MKRLLLALLLSVTPALAANQTFHVRPDGNDTTCNGTANASSASAPNCAELTIQAAINDWSGTGNTVLLHAGTINGGASCTTAPSGGGTTGMALDTSRSGASGAYNVIKAANDGAVSVSAAGCDYQANITASYIQLGSLTSGEGFTLLGNATLQNSWDGFPANGIVSFEGSATNGRVYGLNFAANTGATGMGSGDVGPSQLSSRQSGAVNHHFAGNTIRMGNLNAAINVLNPGGIGNPENCDVFNPVFVTNVIIENNTFLYDNSEVTNGNTSRKHVLGGERWKDITVRNNYIRIGTPGSPASGDFGAKDGRSSCRHLVQNNYVEFYGTTGGNGVFYSFDGGTGESTINNRNKFYNNTIYGSGPSIGIYASSAGDQNEYVNNTIIGVAAGGIGLGLRTAGTCSTKAATIGYNSTFNVTTASQTCASDTLLGSNRTANPLLNLSGAKPTPFFQLQAGSPLINAGCPTATCPNAPTTDYDGETRSNPPDIGADEFISGGASCGDGTINGTEQCDGAALGGATCISRGYAQGGTLVCSGSCTFDTSNCCGDNVKGTSEVCDGTDLVSQTCILQGFAGGTLSCSTNCASFNTSSCTVSTTKSATLQGVTLSGGTAQ